MEDLAMLLGDAEHVADDRDRQPVGKISDQVHASAIDDRIQRLVDHLFNTRTHVLHPARGEGFDDEIPQARMLGRIRLQYRLSHVMEDRFIHDLRAVTAFAALDEILAEALVPQHKAYFRVPTDYVGAERRQ